MSRCLLMALVVALIMVGGCIDYQETLKFNEDGSGTLKIRYALDKQYLNEMEQMGEKMGGEESEEPENADEDMWTREEIEEALKVEDTGVELIGYEASEDEEWKIWVIEFSFDNLADFEMLSRSLNAEADEDGEQADIDRSYTRQDDGTWLYQHDFGGGMGEEGGSSQFDTSDMDSDDSDAEDMPTAEELAEAMKQMQEAMQEYSDEDEEGEDANPEAGEQEEQMEEAMQNLSSGLESMFAGMENARVKVTAEFPGKIIESNATSVDGNTATWEFRGKAVIHDDIPMMTAKVQP
ncbi:MAG: hypothetical protein ABIK83_14545 [Candidatus Zixiibacteriota bacterium]